MKISIIGLPGSGKTYVAESISKKLSIPHIHIDRFWFEAGGKQGSKDTPNIDKVRSLIRQKTTEATKATAWVSDGFYSRTAGPELAQQADTILFLDILLWRRLLNHFERILKPSSRHQEITTWDEITFFYEIIRRTYANGPKMKSFAKEYENKVIILRSRKEINKYLQKLT